MRLQGFTNLTRQLSCAEDSFDLPLSGRTVIQRASRSGIKECFAASGDMPVLMIREWMRAILYFGPLASTYSARRSQANRCRVARRRKTLAVRAAGGLSLQVCCVDMPSAVIADHVY